MDQENENHPPPVKTEPTPTMPDQRPRRPRRRYPRRRYYNRDERGENFNSSNSSPGLADPAGENPGVETLDRPAEESAVETGEQISREPEFGEGRQSRSAIDEAAHNQWRRAHQISGPAAVRGTYHHQSQ